LNAAQEAELREEKWLFEARRSDDRDMFFWGGGFFSQQTDLPAIGKWL